LLTRWSGYCCPAFDRQYDDTISPLENWHRKSDGARLLAAAIPCNQDIPADVRPRRRRDLASCSE
jgi:hypothetical protein